MNSCKVSFKTTCLHVSATSLIIPLVLLFMCLFSSVSVAKLRPGSDSIVALGAITEDLEGLCRIFVDCTGLRIPDSVASLGRRHIQSVKPRDLRYTDADVFAYVYFDDELVVEKVRMGTFLPEENDKRDSVMTRFLHMFSQFLVPTIVGRVIKPDALSFPGGRSGAVVCRDGFGDLQELSSGGVELAGTRMGCMLLRFGFDLADGGIRLNRIAVVSLRTLL